MDCIRILEKDARTTYLQLYCIQLVNALQLKDRMSALHATQASGSGAAGAMASFSLAPSPGSKPSMEQLCRINGSKPYVSVVSILMTSYNLTIRGQNSSDGRGIRIAILAGPRRSRSPAFCLYRRDLPESDRPSAAGPAGGRGGPFRARSFLTVS